MKWSDRLRERASERWDSRFVWWVKQAEAERVIRELKAEIKELKGRL